jgi:YD repeat-containing protein
MSTRFAVVSRILLAFLFGTVLSCSDDDTPVKKQTCNLQKVTRKKSGAAEEDVVAFTYNSARALTAVNLTMVESDITASVSVETDDKKRIVALDYNDDGSNSTFEYHDDKNEVVEKHHVKSISGEGFDDLTTTLQYNTKGQIISSACEGHCFYKSERYEYNDGGNLMRVYVVPLNGSDEVLTLENSTFDTKKKVPYHLQFFNFISSGHYQLYATLSRDNSVNNVTAVANIATGDPQAVTHTFTYNEHGYPITSTIHSGGNTYEAAFEFDCQ